VAGADASARDEESRALAARLRETLERRSAETRQAWVDDIAHALDEGRVVRALRVSARPPEPGTRFPADLAGRLTEAAAGALRPDVAPDRWLAVLEAVTASPVRRTVKPAGLPADADEQVIAAARRAAGQVPALAPLPGLPQPPPPGPPRVVGPRAP